MTSTRECAVNITESGECSADAVYQCYICKRTTSRHVTRRTHLSLGQLIVRDLPQHAGHMAPQAARGVGALVHPPGRVVAKVFIGGAHFSTHAAKLPRLFAALADALLPVRGVRGRELDHWRGLWLRLGLDRLGWRRGFQFFHAVDRVPVKKSQTQKC